jgi:uncharacterized protein
MRSLNAQLKKLATKENIILLSVAILLPLYMRLGTPASFDLLFGKLLSSQPVQSVVRVFYHYGAIFLMLAVIPVCIITGIFREKLSDYGIRTGDYKTGFKIVFLLLIPLAGFMVLTTLTDGSIPPLFHSVYPSIPLTASDPGLFFMNALFMSLYYISFEFFYRGYMLFGLKDRFGAAAAILIQTIPSVIIHFDKPNGELFASVLGEILFGVLALRTGSILYGILIHYFLGVSLELATILF